MNGPPTEREYQELAARVLEVEKQVASLKEWRAHVHGISLILGSIAGIVSAALVTVVIRAVGWG